MLHLTRIIIEFTILAAVVSLGITGGRLLRDHLRQSSDSSGRLLVGMLTVTSLVMLGLAVAILTPLASAQSSITAIAGLQVGLLVLVLATAGLDTWQVAQGERQLRESLAAFKRELEELKRIEAQRREQQALEYKLQARQLQEGLMPHRAQEPSEIWIVPERDVVWEVPVRPGRSAEAARPRLGWPSGSRWG